MNRGVHCARIYIIDRINRVDLNQVCLTGNAPGKRNKNGEEGVWYTINSIGIPANRLLLIWGGRLLKKSLKLNPI